MSDSLPFLTLFGCCACSRIDLTAGVPEVRPAHLLQPHTTPHHCCLPASQQLCKALVQFTSCHRRLAVLADSSCPFDNPVCLLRLCQSPIVSFSTSGELTSTAAVLVAAVSSHTSMIATSWILRLVVGGLFQCHFRAGISNHLLNHRTAALSTLVGYSILYGLVLLCNCLHLAAIRADNLGNRAIRTFFEGCSWNRASRLFPGHLLQGNVQQPFLSHQPCTV